MQSLKWEETYNNRSDHLYQIIVEEIRNIVILATNQSDGYLAECYRSVLSILIQLNKHCEKKEPGVISHNIQKLSEVLRYLETHYMESISLSDIAAQMHLSVPYTSKCFKENVGMGFGEYLTHLRIQKSIPLLLSSEQYILDIALSVGFNNTKTYSRSFYAEYNMTPSEYRNLNKLSSNSSASIPVSKKDLIPNMLDFLHKEDILPTKDTQCITIDQDLIHPVIFNQKTLWTNTLSVGAASLLLQQKIQSEVILAVKDIGYKYIHITGILSDIMHIYQEDEKQHTYYFWGYVDEILDFLCSYNLKPYISLSYMPNKLASAKPESPYAWQANISKPASFDKWSRYINAFFLHLISRYGYEEVCAWKFEFWNSFIFFWNDSIEDFYRLFQCTYNTFRKIIPDGCFGAPAFTGVESIDIIRHFLEFCVENQIQVDFFPLHLYMATDPNNTMPVSVSEKVYDNNTKHTHNYSEQFINNTIYDFQQILSSYHQSAPIIISEWNLSPYYHDYIRDTCFMNTYIVHTLNCLPTNVNDISFWSLTDSTGEHSPNQAIFSGEIGLKTYNGLAKPSYLVFTLLNRLTNNIVCKGNGYRITTSPESTQILLYNYTFFSKDFLQGDSHKLTYKDRYQIYSDNNNLDFHLHLTLAPGEYRIEKHSLTRECGSTYDSWINMGAPDYIDQSIVKYLQHKGCADIKITTQHIENHFMFTENIPPHGVVLIILSKSSDE